MNIYVGLVRKYPQSSYGIDFPDFPGCISGGETLDDAIRRAEEAMNFHIKGMIEDGQSIPKPTLLDTIVARPQNREAIPILVRSHHQKGRAIRVNITLEDSLLADIDAYVQRHHQSRSAFLANAARHMMHER